MLGLHTSGLDDGSWLSVAEEPLKDGRQVELDVVRSVAYWDIHRRLSAAERGEKRALLSCVLRAILHRHSSRLRYCQGFHDVCSVFCEVFGFPAAFHVAERFTLYYVADCLGAPFVDAVMPLLRLVGTVVDQADREVGEIFRRTKMEMQFCVPWLITHFCHVLPSFWQVARLFDCFLAAPPCFVLYLSAAIVLSQKERLQKVIHHSHGDAEGESGCYFAEIHFLFQSIDWGRLPLERIIKKARYLMEHVVIPDRLIRVAERRGILLPPFSPIYHSRLPWFVTRHPVIVTLPMPSLSASPAESAADDDDDACHCLSKETSAIVSRWRRRADTSRHRFRPLLASTDVRGLSASRPPPSSLRSCCPPVYRHPSMWDTQGRPATAVKRGHVWGWIRLATSLGTLRGIRGMIKGIWSSPSMRRAAAVFLFPVLVAAFVRLFVR
ncbi:unnamed protein product [Vitrella brassicaformis CCMP3155]|uniref:Rab-GAP TBC domain-containing protein n=1 Tax=Vitrella brassicaformis (strain CCMP3155) TaxID=1169540 RepID=A0A0G4EPB1_VITBC|nr:unnamed protein product [Vitrella brassicaformis CCMP3155]|eukprot:CEL99264.1 unnamed protein product [Vitrella brassicaformis CCMP3155]